MAKITSLDEIAQIVKQLQNSRILGVHFWEFYRGQGSDKFKLQPGIFRDQRNEKSYKKEEQRLFNCFRKKAKKGKIVVQDTFSKDKFPHTQTWFSLFQAQHLGLKTRLLDWTIKWEMAVLFAVDDETLHNEDGQFWILRCPPDKLIKDDSPQILKSSPFEVNEFYTINYPFFYEKKNDHFTAEHRRARQWGRFSIQPIKGGMTPLEEQPVVNTYLEKFVIDKNAKAAIKKQLNDDGFTLDWAYYRHEANISDTIKKINKPSLLRRIFCIC